MLLFKDWLLLQLREHEWTAVEAAKQIGVDESLMSRYLNGKRVPSRQTLAKIAPAFNVKMVDLLEMVDLQDRATANSHGVPADVNTFGMPRGFGDMVWDRLSAPARERIIESVRIEVEEAIDRGEI